MLKKILKWAMITIVSIAIILLVAGWILVNQADKLMAKTYSVEPRMIIIPDDSTSISDGKVWTMILCTGCHGDNLEGIKFFDDPSIGSLNSPNLTAGLGGVGFYYTDKDWIRSIKHGVRPDGSGLFVMPSADFNYMTDEDIGEIIAYLKNAPPVDNKLDTKGHWTTLAKILLSLGAFGQLYDAEEIDHKAGSAYAPEEAPTPEYGTYLVNVFGCRTCHGQAMSGGKDPDPAAPFGPNITPGGNLGNWSSEQFITAMRTGITPEGKELTKYMPWKGLANMNDDNLTAIYLYLSSLPVLETPEEFKPETK